MTTLKQFYRELQAWIDAGCPEHDVFREKRALCRSLGMWAYSSPNEGMMYVALITSFEDADLDLVYPFNETLGAFNRESASSTIYKNPARLAWIKEHAA